MEYPFTLSPTRSTLVRRHHYAIQGGSRWGRRSWCPLVLWELRTNFQQVNPEGVEGVQPGNKPIFSITLKLIPQLCSFALLFHFQLPLDLWYWISCGFIFPWDVTLMKQSTGINSNYHLLSDTHVTCTMSVNPWSSSVRRVLFDPRFTDEDIVKEVTCAYPRSQHEPHGAEIWTQASSTPGHYGSNAGSETVSQQAPVQTITPP